MCCFVARESDIKSSPTSSAPPRPRLARSTIRARRRPKSHLTVEQLKLRAGIDMCHIRSRRRPANQLGVWSARWRSCSVSSRTVEPLIKELQVQGSGGDRLAALFSLTGRADHESNLGSPFVSDTFNAPLLRPARTAARDHRASVEGESDKTALKSRRKAREPSAPRRLSNRGSAPRAWLGRGFASEISCGQVKLRGTAGDQGGVSSFAASTFASIPAPDTQ